MTSTDILEAKKFVDGITRSRYFIDIHNPQVPKTCIRRMARRVGVKTGFGPPAEVITRFHSAAVSCRNCPNLLVACRALSATHEAAAAVRVMATMHGIGEAAGIACAQACRQGIDVTDVSGAWIRSQLAYMSEGPDFGGTPWQRSAKSMEKA